MNDKSNNNSVKEIDPKSKLDIINKIKLKLKKLPLVIDLFKEYDVSLDELDYFPIRFGDLDVSAKTDHGIIILNNKLLEQSDIIKICSYVVHELTHVLQQTTGDKPTQGSDDGEYLDNKYEKESFQQQIKFLNDMKGEKEAEDYTDQVLTHHDINDNKERQSKKNELMKLVDE